MPNQRLETEKKRAEKAYEFANNGIKEHGEKYDTIVGKLPMQIKTNGICETVAFHFSKSKKENGKDNAHKFVCEQLWQWLKLQKYISNDNSETFALELVKLSPAMSRAVTNETLIFLNWLRRFTVGISEQKVMLTNNGNKNGEL